jgi:EmrB/QacA subfamily drug resistance transporter
LSGVPNSRPGTSANPPKYWLLLTTVALGGVLAPLNSTMLAVALPDLRNDFQVGHAEIAWLVSAYLIAMAVAQPLGGRIGDQLGRAPVFRAGLIAFLALSLACAVAPTFPLLMLFRTGQALVGAAAIPNGMAMMRESLPMDRLGRSGGFTGSAISISAAVGPLLGAALLELGSWRLLFLMNVPLVGLGLISLALLQYRGTGLRSNLSLDVVGAASFAVLLVAITLLLNGLGGEESVLVLVAATVGLVVFGAVFVRRQASSPTPVAEWRLFRIRSYAASTLFILLGNLVMYTTILAIPFFVTDVLGREGKLTRGVLLACISMPMIVLGPIAGRVSDSAGRRPLVIAGSVLLVVAAASLTVGISNDAQVGFLAGCLLCLGVGMSLSFGPVSAAAIESTPREQAGTAAGTNSMMRYLGSIIGTGVLGAVLNTDSVAPDIGVFRLIFGVLVVMALGSFACSLFVHRFPEERLSAPTATPANEPLGVGVSGS